MTEVLIPLATGCEEIEAVTLIDLLRRADIKVTVASLAAKEVRGAHNIGLIADVTLDEVKNRSFDMVALPGGQPGSDNLNTDPRIHKILKHHHATKWVGAICAAPKVLVDAGLVDDSRITAYPGVLDGQNTAAELSTEAIECDGNIITSRSPGTAMEFALTIIEKLIGKEKRSAVEADLIKSP
ncbi:MAG: DJ-1/PfpI family protein [Chromatiales bacterium]|nr:DJ-1/PfpI family protein [Chromatiales bacterium]